MDYSCYSLHYPLPNVSNTIYSLAEILEPPVNQHVLIGDNVTVTCKTRGTHAYWVLNGTSLTISHPEVVNDYVENLGILFIEETAGEYFNLTMIAPAVELMNGTTVVCTARVGTIRIARSAEVKIMVYHTLRTFLYFVRVGIGQIIPHAVILYIWSLCNCCRVD